MYSCSDNDTSQDGNRAAQQPIVVEAMNYVKDKELSMLDMGKTFRKSTRMLIVEANSRLGELTPDWSMLQIFSDENNDIRMFLFKNVLPVSGFVYTKVNGKVAEQIAVSTSKLALWKIEGTLVGRIITYISDDKFLRNSESSIAQQDYQLEGSDFSGICLVSMLDGLFLYGDKYDEG